MQKLVGIDSAVTDLRMREKNTILCGFFLSMNSRQVAQAIDQLDGRTDGRTDTSPTHRRLPLAAASVSDYLGGERTD